ncbi:tryptophan synthase subunit alpha [Pseudoteredinibacter isoporae]|uniref:Tryptophan synthase alpha chain n=1 Tax=Pseudoteredinibacter isoporae TaxID=570281 RepID=A0A7X0MXI4_9GAMM|nr:tryptophan synthase subunit alpha [Pseudoteredinibacter isoporae]MBB6520967.1 tryptophan synthase alpha chain [Pseudoteredinibacter isoporae]NHO86532.1 tryptophan synthase subunit alpha [Pseudoteredinibacter isoporae]NIB25016.1 tryptophan synthase subunit alpha [Pseudoteredinibacter isoporae]
MALNEYIASRKQNKDLLLMTHVVCGYPSFEANLKELEIMAEAGVDFVELQFPFSEPSADGPLFVKANQIAVESGVTVEQCFEFMAKVSQRFDFKVLMMGYYNTVFKMGHEAFVDALKAAGGCGFIVPDLPLEEAKPLHDYAKTQDIAPIVLMTPTNTDERLQTIAEAADGFVYVVARRGVTGSKTEMDAEVGEFLDKCRTLSPVPIGVGFGVSAKEDLEFLAKHADMGIIGTAALKAWERGEEKALRDFFASLGLL